MLQTGVVSLVPEHIDCEEYAAMLSRQGIAVRAGYHCAPLAHKTAHTDKTGTVRLSVSPFLAGGDIERAIRIIQKI